MNLRCPECEGRDLVPIEGEYQYLESGLDYIYLVGVPRYRCTACEETIVCIPNEEGLLAAIASYLVGSETRLGGAEIRFLRHLVGWSQHELANRLDVKKLTVTRWESGENPIDKHRDITLRLVWVNAYGRQYQDDHEARMSGTAKKRLSDLLERLDSVADHFKMQCSTKLIYDAETEELREAA